MKNSFRDSVFPAMIDKDLAGLIKPHVQHFTPTEDGRLKCELNGHVFPANKDVIAAFIK